MGAFLGVKQQDKASSVCENVPRRKEVRCAESVPGNNPNCLPIKQHMTANLHDSHSTTIYYLDEWCLGGLPGCHTIAITSVSETSPSRLLASSISDLLGPTPRDKIQAKLDRSKMHGFGHLYTFTTCTFGTEWRQNDFGING